MVENKLINKIFVECRKFAS